MNLVRADSGNSSVLPPSLLSSLTCTVHFTMSNCLRLACILCLLRDNLHNLSHLNYPKTFQFELFELHPHPAQANTSRSATWRRESRLSIAFPLCSPAEWLLWHCCRRREWFCDYAKCINEPRTELKFIARGGNLNEWMDDSLAAWLAWQRSAPWMDISPYRRQWGAHQAPRQLLAAKWAKRISFPDWV